MMTDLIGAYESTPWGPAMARLEAALLVTGPLLWRGHVYGVADARPVESIEVLRDVRRAELVPIPPQFTR